MTGREEALENALSIFSIKDGEKKFTPGYTDSSFMFFAEGVVGLSFHRLINHLEAIGLRVSEIGEFRLGNLSFTHRPEKKEKAVYSLNVHKYGVPKYALSYVDEDDERQLYRIDISELDPANPDYAYPERIASGSLIKSSERPLSCIGYCQLHRFGTFVEAMTTLRPVLNVPALKETENGYSEIGKIVARSRYYQYEALIREDGGLAGSLALEAAETFQNTQAKGMMKWAREALLETYKAAVERDLVWG